MLVTALQYGCAGKWAVESSCGLFFALPLCGAISQLEKRLVVRRRQIPPALVPCRMAWWPFIFASVEKFVFEPLSFLYTRTYAVDSTGHASTALVALLIRAAFMLTGLYLGQSFFPLALTGSIATGKSTVAKILSEASSPHNTLKIIDTDKIGHEILLSPKRLASMQNAGASNIVTPRNSVYSKIIAKFGDSKAPNQGILDNLGEIDRRKLGDIIFQDPTKRRQLNQITHPRIIYVMLSQLVAGSYSRTKPVMIADVPLLFESGLLRWLFGLTIVVATSADLQLLRLRKRNPDLTEAQCQNRIASQMPVERKVAMANIVIWNNGSYEELQKQVDLAWTDILRRLERARISSLGYLLIASGYILFKCLPMYL